jgi:phosphate transport system substrate-binding protein
VKVISGKISLWSELIPGEAADSITLLFDHANSSITRFILDSLSENGKFPASSFASGSQEKLFDYLSENPSAIGFTGVNWLMHPHPDWKTKLEKVSILGLSSIQPDDSVIYYQPFLTYETQPHYPLSRHLFLLSRETYIGLGTAFATFVASDKGQTVVRRAGMLPARQPLRIIELKSDFE